MKLGSSAGSEYTNETWTNENVYIEPVDGTDEHSGHKTTIYNINGAKTLNNQTMGTTLKETGIYEITVITTDNMGNKANNTYTVKIDKENPTCGTVTMKLGSSTGSEYTNNTWTNESIYIAPVNGSDNHSGHNSTKYSVSGAIELNDQTEGITLTETGIYTITVETADTVGNTATNSYTVKIDKTAPTAGTMAMKLNSNEGTTYINDTWTNQNVYIEQVEGTDEHSGHKSTTYSVNGPITLENQTEPTILTEEGIYTITVKTLDNMGNVKTNTNTVKIDKTAPTAGTITMKLEGSKGEAYTNGTWTNQSVYIEAADGEDEHSGHSRTTYSISRETPYSVNRARTYGVDRAATLNNQTEATTLAETGIYEITVTTTDIAGNTATDSYTIKIDKTAPTAGTVTMKLDNSEGETYTNDTWTNQSVYIEPVDGSDEHSGHSKTTYSVSGAITLENQTKATTLTETGIYTITVTTTDVAGNIETNSYTIKIDKTVPTAGTVTMRLENSEGETYTNDTWTNQSVYIEPVNGSDEHSGHSRTTYSISGAVELNDQTEATTLTETGVYTITVITTDNMGYTATNEYTIKIDKVNPTAGTITMRLENSEGETYTNDTWTNQSVYIDQVQGTDELSGHNKTTYSINGAITLEDQTEATILTETGTYEIAVTTIDMVGNISTNSYTVKIDKKAPIAGTIIMKLGSNEGSEYTNDMWTNQSVYIEQVEGTDEHSGHSTTTYSISGTVTLENQTEAMILTETGTYEITVTTTDNMGNTSTNTYTVKIDKVLPTLTVNPASGEYAKTREVTITVGDEGGSNLNNNNSYQYYLSNSNTALSDGEWKNYENGEAFTIGQGKTGTYYLFVKKITDSVGNTNTAEGIIETTDAIPCQIYGEYKFDNTIPIITKTELINNKITIEANDINEENSGLSKYRYMTSDTKLTNPEITIENSIEMPITGEIVVPNINEAKYIYLLVEDLVGNTSKIVEIEVPQIKIEGETNLDTEDKKGEVHLNIEIGGKGDKTYKIYQKSETDEEWQEVLRTNETNVTVTTAKDLTAPNLPTISVNEIDENDEINISQTTTDKASVYTFYVEVCDRENNDIILATSNEITKEVKTGEKGYYYILDDNLDNEFNIENSVYTEAGNLKLDIQHNGQYIRMKAVDVAGNISEEGNVQIYITTDLKVNLDGGQLQKELETKPGSEAGTAIITGLVGKTIDIGQAEKEGYSFLGYSVKPGTIVGTQGTLLKTKYIFGRENGEITAEYEINNYGYKIEYYYAGIKDETKTKTGVAEYSSIIGEYQEEPREGYVLGRTENYPLTIGAEENKIEGDTITEEEANNIQKNIMKIYYEKRTDLEYTINYLEAGTNKVIHEPKEAKGQTFENIITANDEAIDIPGYYYESSDKENITIAVNKEQNVINLYYVKRNDLTYTVKYLEKETEKEIREQTVVENQLFESEVTIPEEIEKIEIAGYNYNSTENNPITITANEGENIVKVYYTRRNDLSYKVIYLDRETNEEIKEQKIVENQTFEAVVETSKEIIEIEGYINAEVDEETIMITVNNDENVINIYYTKRKDLSYTVNYLDEDGEEIHESQIVENQEYGKEIIAKEIAIEIEGHTYDESTEQETLTIGIDTSKNIINIYYIKRSDLKYTINYLEKDTNEIIHEAKEEEGVYGGKITAETEKIDIPGYTNATADKEEITIGINEEENVINIYYEKRTDIPYKVEYYYNGTKDESKTVNGTATYLSIIDSYEDKPVEGFALAEEKGIPLTIVAKEDMNVIKIYYKTKAQVKIQYIDKTTDEIIEEVTEEGYVGKEIELEAKNLENYVLVEEPEEKAITMTEEEIVVKYYYIRISKGIVEKHIDVDTGEILYNEVHEGNEGDSYKTEPKEFERYHLVEEKYPENDEGTMEVEAITVTYYYKKEAKIRITVKYLDIETKDRIEEETVITDYKGEQYKVEKKEIQGYEFIEVVGQTEGIVTEEQEVIYYYQKVKVPDNIPGSNGGEITDSTITNGRIPNAGMSKQQITTIVFVVMIVVTATLIVFAIRGTIIYKKYKK